MTSRGRSFTQTSEWESNDYYESTYDSQYPDEHMSGSVSGSNLDHCRLYITNIPRGLNDEGLRAAFSKFGTLQEVYLSKDPRKKYGLIRYETAGEAKLAMMKMNKTEPLKLVITIANKPKKDKDDRPRKDWQEKSSNESRDRSSHKFDSGSVSSKSRSRVPETHVTEMNGDNNVEDLLQDDYGFSDMLDPNLTLELEKLKMEQLKVREEQLECKHRMIMLKQQEKRPLHQSMSNRCILPDGKIVVRNMGDRSADLDVSQSAGAGDSRLPALQYVGSRSCVYCGSHADAYCARCGVTPYCSQRCQARDWTERHRAVCHNLARLSGEKTVRGSTVAEIPPVTDTVAPLRRPHLHKEGHRTDDESSWGQDRNRTRSSPRDLPQRTQNNRQDGDTNDKAENEHKTSQRRFTPNKTPKPGNETSPEPSTPTKESTPKVSTVVEKAPENKVEASPAPTSKFMSAQMNGTAKTDKPVVKPASICDVTPAKKKLVPKNYLIELLSVGDSALLSVERPAGECRSARGQFVCVSLHDQFEAHYSALCEDYVLACDADTAPHTLVPGESCSYFNVEDGGWYRARCLNPSTLALLDASKLVTISEKDKIRKLPEKYEEAPEFCCLLESNTVKLGDNLKCLILSKTADGYKVQLENVETGASAGEGLIMRWVPTVDYPTAKPAVPPGIPEVARPPVQHNSRVLLVEARSLGCAFVRPADVATQQQYDHVVQKALLAGRKGTPLTEPPVKGQTVIGKFVDGLHYRALCKRTNVEKNKYLLEYSEYGNIEICRLEDLYACPPSLDLKTVPTLVSMIKLTAEGGELTPPALEYLEKMKEEEMILTLPNGESSAPSGSEAILKVVKNSEVFNKKIVEMCTPDWKKLQEKGGDVVEVPPLMYPDLEHIQFPVGPVKVDVLDVSALQAGVVSACLSGDKHADYVFTQLTQKMAEYCESELGKEPYLPMIEELCIAKCPPYPQWFRAVMTEQVSGAGGDQARVCYIDYGNVELVPVALLRKMLPEFVRGVPALANHLEIKDFPKDVTTDMILKAAEFMKMNEEGRGELTVQSWSLQEPGMYTVEVPDLIRAMTKRVLTKRAASDICRSTLAAQGCLVRKGRATEA